MCCQRWIRGNPLLTLLFQISLRFPGHHPTSRGHLDPPAAESWSCQGKSVDSFASETQKSTPAGLVSLWSSQQGHEASHSISPTNTVCSRDEPQLQKLLLEKATLKQQLPPGTAGAHPRFLCFVSSTKRPRDLSPWLKKPQGLLLVAEEATRRPTLVREDPR